MGVAAAQEETAIFRSDTTLVEFTVTALDKDGNPVTDLKPEEISIRENGDDRGIAFFRFEGGKQEEKPPQLPLGTFSNRPAVAPGPPRNITAILLDRLNTEPQDQVFAREQVMAYLKDLEPDTRVGVYMLGLDLKVIHDFTDDPVALRDSIARAETGLAMQSEQDIGAMELAAQIQIASLPTSLADEIADGIYNGIEIELVANQSANERRALKTLASLELLGDHLAGIPGRKSLVWVTGGIPMMSVTGQMGNGTRGSIRSYEGWISKTGQRLATQGVAIYAVDARGFLGAEGFDATATNVGRADLSRDPLGRYNESVRLNSDPLPSMEKLAGLTGGRALFNTNDMSIGVKSAAADIRGTYSLGFYAVDEPDEKWRNVKVRVARKGVRLRHRNGYVAQAPADTVRPWTEEEWRAAIVSPISATSFQIDAKAELLPDPATRGISIIVQFDNDAVRYRSTENGDQAALIELALVEKLKDGKFGMRVDPIQLPFRAKEGMEPYQFRYEWALMPDSATVQVIVRDQLTGRYGTLDLPVDDLPRRKDSEAQ